MMPDAPQARRRLVFLSARWHALAMLNYEIDPAALLPLVPTGVELDAHEGRHFVSMVGFLMLRTRVLGIPVPWHRHFEEVNLRFYVRRMVGGEVRRGVCFVKEIVPRRAIATTARWFYNEPYVALPMKHALSGPVRQFVEHSTRYRPIAAAAEGFAEYRWRFAGRWNALSLTHAGEPAALVPGSLEEFIAEHYWGYCQQRDGGTVEYEVVHPPWRVWQGSKPQLDCDAAALYGPQFGRVLDQPPQSAFLADGSEVAVLRPRRIA
ncbi:MAG: DUF2071 domain-containing protein [Pirellulaceae bacterium]|nr:DUF2071 domain-containing protein [Pirellulaceae bacterium]